jgi:hypothetical protein
MLRPQALLLLPSILLLSFAPHIDSFRFIRPIVRSSSSSNYPITITRLYAEDGVSLVGLIDVEVDSLWLGDAVCNWLDKEYIPLDIHRTIGTHCLMLDMMYDG